MRPIRAAAVATVGALIVAGSATANSTERVDSFRPLATFEVPDGGVAEIVATTPNGRQLVYSDSEGGAIGLVDISNPAAPRQTARIAVPGEPTAVAVSGDGRRAVVAVRTATLEVGAPPAVTPGRLVVIDLRTGGVISRTELGDGPDSVALTRIRGRDVAVVAIENEPIVVDAAGNLTAVEEPGDPRDISGPGLVQVIDLANPAAPRVIDVPVDLARTRLLFRDDPQPEFADIRGTQAAVSLQENNGIAIVDIGRALAGREAVRRVFSLGIAANRRADLTEDATIDFRERYPRDVDRSAFPRAGARTPDAVGFSGNGRVIYSADEGEADLTGGRGWSAYDAHTGRLVFEDRGRLEREAVALGHYPDGRSAAKGIEIEGIEVGRFGARELVFVGSERGSFLAVYDITRNPRRPRFVQLLATGNQPEGTVAIPRRALLVAADEASGSLTIFEGQRGRSRGNPEQPTIRSGGVREPWSAISGLAGDPEREDLLYGVPDDALPSAIYRIRLRGGEARLRATPITKGGAQARYDLEGVVVDSSIAAHNRGLNRMGMARRPDGFWLASEGNAGFGEPDYLPNLLVQTDRQGRVLQEVPLPAELDSPTGGLVRSNGFEGVAVSDGGRYLLAAIQRPYAGDAPVGGVRHTRIARYDLLTQRWDFFLYPLEADAGSGDFVGLSEIVNLGGDRYAVIERDKLVAGAARVKRVYELTLDGVTPSDGAPIAAGADLSGRVIQKTLLRDVQEEVTPFEKVEGLAITPGRRLWGVIDNDGGEHVSRLFSLGRVADDVDLWLSVLHSNDGESRLIGTPEAGGVARFATVVDRLRGESGRFGDGAAGEVTISSGDNILAGPEFNASLERGVPYFDSLALDRVGFDALAIGNHEFDFGPEVLADLIRGTERTGPFISANLDVGGEPALAALAASGRLVASTVVVVSGRRVGVIGATTPRLPFISSPGAVTVSDVAQAVSAEVAALEAGGVDIVILSSHLQSIEEDIALAGRLRGVDVMIAGGGSELLADPEDLLLPGDVALRPYPVTGTDAEGRAVPIVTTSGDHRYVGRLVVVFDGDGRLVRVNRESGPVRVIGGDAPDAAAEDAELLLTVVEPVRAAVDALAASVIAETEVRLSGVRDPGIRTQETNLGNLVADALLFEGRRVAAAQGVAEPQIALQNGGGIRNNDIFPADLASGITELDTFEVLPFSNFVAVVPDVPRETVKALLENAVSRVERVDGRFAQVAGFSFTWDAAQAPGSRVVSATLDSGEPIIAAGAVVPGAAVGVATIDFSANGGDEYPFGDLPFLRSPVSYLQALASFLVAPEATGGLGGVVTAVRYPEVPAPGNGTRITRLG